jgi:glycosyltransferase involved in cell wall biosynthesis
MPYGDERAKLRIAMVAACPFPWPRGTPVRILRLAEGLHKLGHEVHVITYHLGDRSTRLGFDVHRIRDVPSYRKVTPGPTLQKLTIVDILLWRELRRFLKRVPVDLIHAHHYEGLLTAYAATKFRKDPVIYDAHTLLGGELPYYRIGLPAGLKKSVGKRLDRIIPHLAHHTIAVTQQIERQIRDDAGVSPQGISVIPNGVELELFQQDFGNRNVTAGEGELIVFAGTLTAYQGIELLLQAFALLTRNRPTCRLRFVTDSPFEPYEQLACDLGIRERVEIVSGAFSGVPEQLHQANVLVNPRVNCDGLPQKLLNYMAAGKPIVSFAGSAKTLEHEKNGLIAKDGDVEAFAAAMARLLDDSSLSAALGAQALETARARSWDVVAQQVEQVYRKVLRHRAES